MLSPSPRIAAPRARTRKAELQRASRRLQTNGVWWNRMMSKTGRRRQPSSALHQERKSRKINKLQQNAATTKTKRGLALYVASLFQIANREKNGSSVKCARNGSTSSAHQATTGSFVPTVNQARTRTVTSCHVMSHRNGENITVMPFNYDICFNIMLYTTIIGTVLA